MEFHILGPLEVTNGGNPVPVAGSRERAVLVMLLLAPNRVVSTDRLVDDLWGDNPPERPQQSLRVFISRLRKALREAGGDDILLTEAPGYRLAVEPGSVDATRFDALVGEGRALAGAGDHPAAADRLAEALALWRGPALAGFTDDAFAAAPAARLEESRLAAVEERIEAELACGRHGRLVAELDALTKAHPLRERLWGQRMLALYRCGRQADALRTYQQLRTSLADELGLAPTEALARLEAAILRHDPALELDPAPATRAPEGPVAFLFSDIEGSTRRWEGNPDAMARDLAHHDELLRAAVTAAGGQTFSHTGDGMCAAFPTAAAAIDAAIAAQRALAGATWVGVAALPVRMAIHAGEAEMRDGNYFGPPLNRTARLLATGSGGQILCSRAAADLAGADLAPGTALVDLGEHRLADLAVPERVFQVQTPGLPSEFPPLRSPGTHRHNLPAALTAFVGRQDELAELEGLLHTSRLVTLTGVGGAGKTRLAQEAATGALGHYPDGTWLVELASLRDAAQVPAALLNVLGIASTGLGEPAEMEERACAYLSSRSALVVLDNCEHLVDATAGLVRQLLMRCPGVTVLATSREVLGLAGETTWVVPPLSLPPVNASGAADLVGSDAVALFCDRARAAHAGFDLTDEAAAPVARICHRLDGLPLALELAAARLRLLGPHELARRLDDRLRLLRGGPRGGDARHQTLRAMIDWSYDLLSAEEQAVLRRLAVFPESFDIDAAETVADAGDGVDAFELLARLVDKSLVVLAPTRSDERRYRLLETIRQYAGEKLAEAGEEAATRRRHAEHFVSFCQSWPLHPLSAQSLGGAGREQENFRAALDWWWAEGNTDNAWRLALAMWVFWYWSGDPHGMAWIERIVTVPYTGPTGPVHILAFARLAFAWPGSPGYADVERHVDEVLELSEGADDPLLVAGTRFAIGEYHLLHQHPEVARPLIEGARITYQEAGFPDMVGWCHHHLGFVAVEERDFELALREFERAVEFARGKDADWLAPHALGGLAPLAAHFGDGETARQVSRAAIEAARNLPAAPVLAMALVRAAEAAALGRDWAEAETRLDEVLRLLRDLGMRRFAGDALELAALMREQRQDFDGAAELLGAAAVLRAGMGEGDGGVRVIASEIGSARQRLTALLGATAFEAREHRGRSLPLEMALTRGITGH